LRGSNPYAFHEIEQLESDYFYRLSWGNKNLFATERMQWCFAYPYHPPPGGIERIGLPAISIPSFVMEANAVVLNYHLQLGDHDVGANWPTIRNRNGRVAMLDLQAHRT